MHHEEIKFFLKGSKDWKCMQKEKYAYLHHHDHASKSFKSGMNLGVLTSDSNE